MRSLGLMAKKLGMTAWFNENDHPRPVTLLDVSENFVVFIKEHVRGGYAVQVGHGLAKKVTKPLEGHFKKAGTPLLQRLQEFHVPAVEKLVVGQQVDPSFFGVGDYVDVAGIVKGRGFAGVMKRHGFGGLRASHGVSVSHRSHGSTGQRQDPGKVFKNKKMAGHYGGHQVKSQNLKIVFADYENHLLVVEGSVSGPENGIVTIQHSVKKPLPQEMQVFSKPYLAA